MRWNTLFCLVATLLPSISRAGGHINTTPAEWDLRRAIVERDQIAYRLSDAQSRLDALERDADRLARDLDCACRDADAAALLQSSAECIYASATARASTLSLQLDKRHEDALSQFQATDVFRAADIKFRDAGNAMDAASAPIMQRLQDDPGYHALAGRDDEASKQQRQQMEDAAITSDPAANAARVDLEANANRCQELIDGFEASFERETDTQFLISLVESAETDVESASAAITQASSQINDANLRIRDLSDAQAQNRGDQDQARAFITCAESDFLRAESAVACAQRVLEVIRLTPEPPPCDVEVVISGDHGRRHHDRDQNHDDDDKRQREHIERVRKDQAAQRDRQQHEREVFERQRQKNINEARNREAEQRDLQSKLKADSERREKEKRQVESLECDRRDQQAKREQKERDDRQRDVQKQRDEDARQRQEQQRQRAEQDRQRAEQQRARDDAQRQRDEQQKRQTDRSSGGSSSDGGSRRGRGK